MIDINNNFKRKQKTILEAVLIKADGTEVNMGVISHNYSLFELIKLKIIFLFKRKDLPLYEFLKQISLFKEIKKKFNNRN